MPLGAVPPLAASDTAKQLSNPSQLQQAPEAKSLVREIHIGAASSASAGDASPLNKPPSTAVPRVLRVIRGGGGQAGV